jgi:hypothetical protein
MNIGQRVSILYSSFPGTIVGKFHIVDQSGVLYAVRLDQTVEAIRDSDQLHLAMIVACEGSMRLL